MKILPFIFCAVFLVGCTSSRQAASISREQAGTLAVRFANDKAFAQYRCRPFRDTQSIHFTADHWTWTDRQGIGRGDIEAKVEIASNGTVRSVEIQLLEGVLEMQAILLEL